MEQQPTNTKDNEPTYQPPHYPYMGGQQRSHKKLIIIVCGIVIAALAGGAAVWFFVLRAPTKPAITRRTAPAQMPALSTEEAAKLQTFKSAKLNVQVTYRKDWKITEPADKTELVLTSPNVSYQKSDGSQATGSFTVKIREDVPAAMQTTILKAVASQDSEVIAYAQPTDTQRHYTNLSYAGANPNVFNFFMITGDNAYKTGAAFGAGIDLTGTTYIIAGGYGSDSNDALAFDSVPKASAGSTMYDQGLDIVKTLQVY